MCDSKFHQLVLQLRFFSDDSRCLAALDPEEGAGLRLWQLWDHSLSNEETTKDHILNPSVISTTSVSLTEAAAQVTASEDDFDSERKSRVAYIEQRRLMLAYVLLQTTPLAELQRRAWKPLAILIDQVR